jgi:hypothetical protein
VIAPAIRRDSSGPGFARLALGAALLAAAPAPAAAEVGAVISAYTDLRYRGVSLSDGRPVGILDISYDATNGLYGALSGSLVASRHEGVKPLGLTVNGGYAARIGRHLSGDVGIVHSRYSHYSGVASGRTYTEIYAGLSSKFVGTRLSLSPNYVGKAAWTLHGEINGHVDLTSTLFLDGELGALIPLRGNTYSGSSRGLWDARVGMAKRVGRVSLHAAMSARAAGADVYGPSRHRRVALILGVSSAL